MISPAIALYLAPVFVLLSFAVLRPRTAVIVSYIVTWLFLPIAALNLPGIPDYTKVTATNFGILAGVMLFDPARILQLRFRAIDLPMAVWIAVSAATSLTNGLGAYDAMSSTVGKFLFWGIPYLIGRAYFADRQGLRALALGILIGGLIYVPLCLLEVRFSPQLHRIVYGYHQHSWAQTKRGGGFRPMVFMRHGLEVGMWMTAASLVAFWGWRGKAWRTTAGVPIALAVLILLVTSVLCKSTGALLLLAGAIVLRLALDSSRKLGRLMIYGLFAVAPIYLTIRVADLISPEGFLKRVPGFITPERLRSLEARLMNEELLKSKAMSHPLLGWGGYARSRVIVDGKDLAVTDSLWIIALGQNGLVGLFSLTGVLILPGLLTLRRLDAERWGSSESTPIVALAVVLGLNSVDFMLNAHPNLIFLVVTGGLIGASKLGDRSSSDPEGAAALAESGRMARLEGRRIDAVEAWTLALHGLEGDGPPDPEWQALALDVRNNLAWLLCLDPDSEVHNPTAAAGLAAEVLAIEPRHHAARNTLALAFCRLNDPEAAIHALGGPASEGLVDGYDLAVHAMAMRLLGHPEESAASARRAEDALADGNGPAPDLVTLLDELAARNLTVTTPRSLA